MKPQVNDYYSVKDPRAATRQATNIQNSMFESSNPRTDLFSSIANDKIDNFSHLKVHRGPFNLNAVTMRDPNLVMSEICEALKRLSITYKKLGPFNAKCEFKDLKFIIEVNYVEKFANLFVIKFYKNNQTNGQYFDVCSNIFALLNL